MKKILKSLPIYLIPACCILFNACIDDPVNPYGNKVSATLYYNDGSKLLDRSDFYYVSPGNYPITQFGPPYLTINTFSPSYDLVINTYWQDYTVKFTGINSSSPNIIYHDPEIDNSSYTGISFFVKVPPNFDEISRFFYKLVSETISLEIEGSFQLSPGDSIGSCYIYVPYESIHSVSGDLVIFKAEQNTTGEIDFQNFGFKKIENLTPGVMISFAKEELTYDIPETIVHFQNIPPAGRGGYIKSIKLCFYPLVQSNELTIYRYFPNQGDISIPILPLDHKIKLTGSYRGGNYWEDGFVYKYLNVGENAIVTHKDPIELVDPPDLDSNINFSTVFRIYDNETGGVYMYQFIQITNHYISKKLRIFSQNKELTFEDVFCRGFEYKPNTLYYWSVIKYPEFLGIDDFTSSPYSINPKYNSVQASVSRTFYTR